MNKTLILVVAALCALGLIASASAQTRVPKTSTPHRRTHVRHDTAKPAGSADSQQMDKDLAKLETRTVKTIPARRTPVKKVVPGKTINQQDRHSNPPINFSYSGKSGYSSHTGGASQKAAGPRTSAPMKAGPRLR
jgi:hypothetical protein